jgi:nucleotide-binding universal stress UspA family protein
VPARVLFAVAGNSRPNNSLQRAWRLSRALDAELHVLRVLPDLHRVEAFVRSGHTLYDSATLERFLEACRQLRDWCSEVGSDELLPPEHWQVRTGDFVEEVAIHVRMLDATWVVIAPQFERMGPLVTALARAAGVPVLLSRSPIAEGRTVVAATDLLNPRYPVLDQAAVFGQRLERPLVAVHNITPRSRLVVRQRQTSPPIPHRDHLLRATRGFPVTVQSVVAREADPVKAILSQARGEQAGMIAVGTRAHSWLHRMTIGSVSERVVDEAQRSVLVIPLAEP